jgi:hypothetical protein
MSFFYRIPTGPVALGETVSGQLGYLQRHRYSFTLDSAQTLNIFLDGLTLGDAFLRIYDSSNRLIALDDNSGRNFDALIQRQFAAGSYTIEVAGNRDWYAGSYALSVSSLTPAAPAINTLSSALTTNSGARQTIQSGDVTRDNTVQLSGTLAVGSTVAIYDGDTLLSSSATGGAGWQINGSTWRYTTPALADGTHNLRAQFSATGAATTNQTVSVLVDTVITGSLSNFALTNTGNADTVISGGSTTDRTLGLSGTAEPNSVVSVYDGLRLLGTATINAGQWSFDTPELSDGRHILSARITDAAGNSYVSSGLDVTIFTGQTAVGETVSGTLKQGQRQSFLLDLNSAQKLRVFLDGQTLSDAFLRIYDANRRLVAWNDDGGGNYDSLIERTFQPGKYTIEAASYADYYSGTFALTIINALTNTLSKVIGTNSGLTQTIPSGGATRDNTDQLTGTFVPGTTVSIYDGSNLLGTSANLTSAWQVSGSNWSFTTTALSDGPHTLTARFTAADSNYTEQSVTVTIDTVATGSLSDTVITNTGATASISANGSTTDRTLELSGTAESGSVVKIYDGNLLLGTANLTGNTWSFTTPSLGTGPHSLTANITDALGNTLTTAPVAVTVTPAATEAPPPASTSAFSIELVYSGNPAYLPAFQQAASRWSSVITGDLPDYMGIDDLRINVSVDYIDGPGGTSAAASPDAFRPGGSLPYLGSVYFDSADINSFLSAGTLDDLALHEMGHVLGFIGPLFSQRGLVDPSNPYHYTGANALARYRELTSSNASFIPLEQGGGSGTAGSHWSESIFGTELMTGYASPSQAQPLSAMTIGALQDLGYSVNYSQADAYTLNSSSSTFAWTVLA